MEFRNIVTLEKPMTHLELPEWHHSVNNLSRTAEDIRADAFDVRQGARQLRNDSRLECEALNENTNWILRDRVSELQQWRILIKGIYDRILRESYMLDEEKTATELEIQAMQKIFSILSECLTMRDSRNGAELTYDDADKEIKNELVLLERNQQLLIDECHKAWEKLTRLDQVKFKVGLEVDNKDEAERGDFAQLDMNRFSANISYKTNPARDPRNSCTYPEWLEHTRKTRQMADDELADTYAIREALFVLREKARNNLMAQQDRTDHAIRKRVFETQKARNELQWQQLRMKEEMAQSWDEIKNLEEALRDKTDSLKLVETRLENRAQRSGMELCLDQAHQALLAERSALEDARRDLAEKIKNAQITYNRLTAHAERLDKDLENKEHSLMTDIRAIDLRLRLKPADKEHRLTRNSQEDRKITLTPMVKEIPKV